MPVKIERFTGNLVKSGLLTVEEVATIQQDMPIEIREDSQELAKHLIRQKKLTKYQATEVYQGKINGLTFGEYVVLDKIGAGGMGQVFKAWHRRMDRLAAIKVMLPKALDSPQAVKRFEREVKAAARLTHPNIVITYDASKQDGVYYLAMEYIDGRELTSVVKQSRHLSLKSTIDYIIQTARGLEYAHKQGIVHRDIKPANLLLDEEGTVKILDMGLAVIVRGEGPMDEDDPQRLTQSGQVMGTCDYMPPEQAYDILQADNRADIYSLGCTLYYLLTGKPVYPHESLVQILLAHREAEIPSLLPLFPQISKESARVVQSLDRTFQKMLAKNPADRQQTMTEVIAELEACRGSATEDSTIEKTIVVTASSPISAPEIDTANLRSRSDTNTNLTAPGAVLPTVQAGQPSTGIAVSGDANSVASRIAARRRRKPNVVWMSVAGVAALTALLIVGFLVVGGGLKENPPAASKERPSRGKSDTPIKKQRRDRKKNPQKPTPSPTIPDSPVPLPSDNPPNPPPPKDGDDLPEPAFLEESSPVKVTAKLRATIFRGMKPAFSPDGKYMAFNYFDGKKTANTKLWDVDNNRESLVLDRIVGGSVIDHMKRGGKIHVGSMRPGFSPDGSTLLTNRYVDSIYYLDAETGRVKNEIPALFYGTRRLAFSPDCKYMVIARDGRSEKEGLFLYDLPSGKKRLEFQNDTGTAAHKNGIAYLAFSPDGKELVSASELTVKLWDVATGKRLWADRLQLSEAIDFTGDYLLMAGFGFQLLKRTGTGFDKVWLVKAKSSDPVENPPMTRSVALFPPKKIFASGREDGKIELRSLQDGKVLTTIDAHEDQVIELLFSPNGKILVSGDGIGYKLWDIQIESQVAQLPAVESSAN